jgi:hypothetical protein
MTEPKDAFDQWREWATKPLDSELSIPADLHGAVMALSPQDRLDRDKVNRAVSEARDPNAQRIWIYESSVPAGTADQNDVPVAMDDLGATAG